MKRGLVWLPLLVFAGLIGVAIWGLAQPNDHVVRSQMVGRALPEFAAAPLIAGKPGVSRAMFKGGRPRLLNVFASWCLPCAAEAPQLARLKSAGVTIMAVAVRDKPSDVAAFLARHGDPFAAVGSDPESRLQLSLGSSGVPESFVIDAHGRIILQHISAITDDDVPRLLAALEAAK